MSTLAENPQHGYLASAVEGAAEKSETEVISGNRPSHRESAFSQGQRGMWILCAELAMSDLTRTFAGTLSGKQQTRTL